jgi:flagellar basal-body rod modification protein FlgD
MIGAASAMPAMVTTLPMGSQLPNAASGPSQTLNENNFLQLLTTQLENQDPLNPINGADFAAQLAEFSTATGVETLQTQMNNVSGVQAAGLVGHNVAVGGNALLLGTNGGGAIGAYNLPSAASDVKVTITDATGNPVTTLDLGAVAAGTQTFAWNGMNASGSPSPPGIYSISIAAAGGNGASIAATPYAVVPVTAVALGGQNGPTLDLGGGLAPVALSAVQQVF